MNNNLKEFFIGVGVLVFFLLFFYFFWYGFSHIGCKNKSISFEAWDYGITSGCMVKHDNKWLPLDNIRGFD